MTRHEITTRLPGGRGEPLLIVREPGWQQAAEAEREARQREETKAFIARIEREAYAREHSPRPPVIPADPVERIHADFRRQQWLDDCAESRAWPERLDALEEWAAKAETERLRQPPADPAAERWQQENEYSFCLAETMARLRG